MPVKVFIFRFDFLKKWGINYKRNKLYRYNLEDSIFLENQIYDLPNFVNKKVLDDLLVEAKKDMSLFYHIEQFVVFLYWYRRYKDYLIDIKI